MGYISAADAAAGVADISTLQDAATRDEGENPLGGGVVYGIVVLPPAPLVDRGLVGLGRAIPQGSLKWWESTEAVV